MRAILDESARYNIGPVKRNVNFPTLALVFLHPRNQHRFAWKRGGTRRFGTVEGLEVEFEEVARPTLVDQDGHGDLPADGRFWIDPCRGTVLRSVTRFPLGAHGARAQVATEYRAEPHLAMWVPAATVAFGEEHWREAVTAFERFGGGQHEAHLNFGDCMAYAVAKLAGEPLLCTGGDFPKTDVALA